MRVFLFFVQKISLINNIIVLRAKIYAEKMIEKLFLPDEIAKNQCKNDKITMA